MITLRELVDSVAWLQPQEHIKIILWNKNRAYEKDEFKDIEFNIKNFAKYADYWVTDLDIEHDNKDNAYLSCSIWKD